jgi:5-methylcytosine-specific restriction endonuclease McrA
MPVRNTTRRDRHRRIIAQDRPPCHWCGLDIDYRADWLNPHAYQIDHVIPLNRGGLDTLDNLVAAHRKCNRDKSDKLPELPTGATYITTRAWTTC